MRKNILFRFLFISMTLVFFSAEWRIHAQDPPKTGEVRFTADNQDERDAGVWIDGKYAGYVKELKGDRKVMLPAGEHEISIRQAGFKEFMKKVVVDPEQPQTIAVVLEENPQLTFPGADAAELRLDIRPKRAAVFMDNHYMGHGSDFGGRFHSMLVTPGKHNLKVTLDGYEPYEMEIDPTAKTKTAMVINLKPSDRPAAQ
ncbi:MAG TPA: PEGA domain-containing protein [Candidatus Acidoferrales bacterium]|nr:PEGA domain-containing protein [Candidatus Acidoferrales bacterium]